MAITIKRTFKEIPSCVTANKRCEKCDKVITKNFKSSQTINPWNNKDVSQILVENQEKNQKKITEWQTVSEKCSKCKSAETPKIRVDLLSEDDISKSKEIIEEIYEIEKVLGGKYKDLNNIFKDKFSYDGERLVKIDSIYGTCFQDIFLSFTYARKDMTGLTEQSNYKRFKDFVE